MPTTIAEKIVQLNSSKEKVEMAHLLNVLELMKVESSAAYEVGCKSC
jgi:hypothetical protein